MSRRVVCDNCSRVEATTDAIFAAPQGEWLHVEGNWDEDAGDFCSLRCLGTWASAKAIYLDSNPRGGGG